MTSSVARAIPDNDSLTSVSDWLISLGLAIYRQQFSTHRLTRVDQLVTLTRSDLYALGITNRQHVDLLSRAIDDIRVMMTADDTRAPATQGLRQSTTELVPTANNLHSPTTPGLVDRV